jgi:AraC-like DNA-binding protein
VFEYHFDHTDFKLILLDIAQKLGAELRGDTLYLSPEMGEGYLHARTLPNGLSILISENCFNFDMLLHRKKLDECFYILGFDEVYIKHQFVEIINGHREKRYPPIFAGVYLNTTFFDRISISSKGNGTRMVKCIFDTRWMSKYLGINKDDEVLKRYLSLRSKNLNVEPLDSEYRNLLEDIFKTDPQNPLFTTIVENRVMMLIERFFTQIYHKSTNLRSLQIRQGDIYRMMEIEKELMEDYSKTAPTVEELAVKHAMGVSKLKRQFKQIYGKPVFEYYQKSRMHKAKDMLLSGEYTVKEVGYKLGYQNLSNFANAFKKEFSVLPSSLTKKSLVAEQ